MRPWLFPTRLSSQLIGRWQLQAQIRNGAAKVGANAIIVNPVEQAKSGVKVLGEMLGTKSATQKASALAIYMPGDAARVRAACG